ncbi:MAG: hypothetical protein M1832_005433 [Thelocarpon impressellum]|nr:MAG: hypothetical protein M1832_005433 [Thelocarpon impressellum]
MVFKVQSLWLAPEVNPINHKARSIPGLNPFNMYGRVFLLSWWGFLVAFWSWYAFPPLMTVTIKKDLQLSQVDVANSNILSLTAGLIVRLTAGSACDRFGPRWTFAVVLLAGAIPTALAGTVTSARGLLAIRFFVGILGGSFIPCQVWTTGFFDKNIVGAANSFAAGFGNVGGGITYFVMPAIFDSLVERQNLPEHVAWRVSFVVPFILITATAVVMIVACPDTPTGKWSARRAAMEQHLATRDAFIPTVADGDGAASGKESRTASDEMLKYKSVRPRDRHHEAQIQEQDLLDAASWEIVEKPTYHGSSNAILSLPTLTVVATYFCSFGGELCINSILASYYLATFPSLGQTGAGNWAAMFGLLNGVFRPIGGMVSDAIYRRTRSLWGKKILIHGLGIGTGVFLLAIGLLKQHSEATMFGLMVGVAFFLEAGNGATFSLVPHVHPSSNGKPPPAVVTFAGSSYTVLLAELMTGIITGVTGASGNLGGIVFLVVARYTDVDYGKVFWIIGAITIGLNVAVSWINPIPRDQLGGR